MARLTYKDAGVDIDAQDEALASARDSIRASFTPGVLGDVGAFGGLFDMARVGMEGAILVASADGVGTKLEVARKAGRYDGVGRDLVQHCVNDVLVQGARPMFFLDYAAMGKLEPAVVGELVRGCADACRVNGLALLGGETAEMPGLYKTGDFELCGFLVGAVQREHLLDGSRVRPGLTLLALASSGLHTNGYSLARRVLFDELGLQLTDTPDELEGVSIADALLAEHRAYHRPLLPAIEDGRIAALAHITGGGLLDNLPRVLGPCDALLERDSWTPPGLFQLLVHGGGLDADESFRAFNMGVGMVVFCADEEAAQLERELAQAGETVWRIGHTVPAAEPGKGCVRWSS